MVKGLDWTAMNSWEEELGPQRYYWKVRSELITGGNQPPRALVTATLEGCP
ncbi:unnamed protein product [Lupinus luteus]|uniref:Uncharacterized protein n=1 Tax=Lupinus luteus TaxID=3873 RepID=A0AAV1XNE4_LUPLU